MTLVCMPLIVKRVGYVLRKLELDLNSVEMWCKRWTIKINEDETWAVYLSHRCRPPEVHS
jgi:hypothetical protein